MNLLKKATAASLAIIAAFSFSSASASAATPEVGIYGIWSTPTFNAETFEWTGEIDFPGAHVDHATYTVTFLEDIPDENYAEVKTTSSKGDWITRNVDMGKAFGSNGPSSKQNLLVTGVTAGEASAQYSLNITFDESVDAGDLAFATIDLDVDSVTLGMMNGALALSGTQIEGSATNAAFNICETGSVAAPSNCDGETSVPVKTVNAVDVSFAEALDQQDVGVAGWVRPSTSVDRVDASVVGSGFGSSLRWVVAIMGDKVSTANKAELANTGTSPVLPIVAALTIAAGVVLVSRRGAKA